ncbi:MAG: hypothetical protein ACLGHN_08565 [Bacteriovoracia bacterium]
MKTTFLLLSLLSLPFLIPRDTFAWTGGSNSGENSADQPVTERTTSGERVRRRIVQTQNEVNEQTLQRIAVLAAERYQNIMEETAALTEATAQNAKNLGARAYTAATPLGVMAPNLRTLQSVRHENEQRVQEFTTNSGINCQEQNFSPALPCEENPLPSIFFGYNYIKSLQTTLAKVFQLPKAPLTREGACNCLKTNLKPAATDEELSEAQSKLKSKVRQELNKKLLDDYSKHIEDFHYFYWSSKEFHEKLGRRRNLNGRDERLCFKGKSYIESFNNHPKCQGANLSDSEKERKISSVFESFGMKLNGTLDQNLNAVKSDILGRENFDCTQRQSSRYCHDQERFVLSRSAGRVGDIIVTSVLKSPDFRDKILNGEEYKMLSPVEAINKIFKSDLDGYNTKLFEILTPEVLGTDIYNMVNNSFNSKVPLTEAQTKEVFKKVNNLVSTAVLHHPGIDRVLQDRNLFQEVSDKIGDSNSVMDYFQNEADFMMEYFDKNCEKIRNNVAESICSSDDELYSAVGEKDLLDLLKSTGTHDDRTTQLVSILACDKPESSSDLLKNLVVNPLYNRTSDYFQEKLIPQEERNSSQASLNRLRDNPKYADFVADLNENFGGSFVSASSSRTNFFDNVEDFASTAPKIIAGDSSAPASDYSAVSGYGAPTEQPSEGQMDQLGPVYSNNSSTAQAFGQSGQSNSTSDAEDSKTTMKRELKEFLRRKGEAGEEAEKMVDNASDDILKELTALREEMDKNQKKILELSSENEKLKLQSLQKQLVDLEKDRAALEPGDPEERLASSSKSKSYLQPTLKNVGRNIAPVTGDVGGNSAGNSAGTSGAAEAGPVSDMNRALASAARGGGGRRPASDSSDTPVVISATSAKSGAIEIRSQEVGLDLLNHLSSNGTDIQTLINLKTSGIIYKYKVIQNGKEIEKEVLIEYSKLNDDVKKIIDKKIAENKDRKKEVLRLDTEIKELQRVYSYSTLQFILAEQMKQNNPGR